MNIEAGITRISEFYSSETITAFEGSFQSENIIMSLSNLKGNYLLFLDVEGIVYNVSVKTYITLREY